MMEKRYILPVRYQSQQIGLDLWFQLFTLCLAPLVLHLATGIPEPTVLWGDPPTSWDRLSLFNPVSILWRYHAIADRRLRAKAWDKGDMAATNAAFWDGRSRRWDGSEEILALSRSWIAREPAMSHVALISASTLSTLGLTMQGIQSIVSITKGSPEALNMAFSYFALFSLFRLVAACWLSNDYGFVTSTQISKSTSLLPTHPQWSLVESMHSPLEALLPEKAESQVASSRFVDVNSLIGTAYRLFWGTTSLATFGFTIWAVGSNIIWLQEGHVVTATAAVGRLFYLVIAMGFLCIHGYYILLGKNQTTILPCAQSTWYKWYTLALMVLALTFIVLSSVETHACLSGTNTIYTTFPCNVTRPY